MDQGSRVRLKTQQENVIRAGWQVTVSRAKSSCGFLLSSSAPAPASEAEALGHRFPSHF